MKPGGTCVFITPAPLFFQSALSGVVDPLCFIVLWVPLVVCHVNSSLRGTFSTLLFKSALFFFSFFPCVSFCGRLLDCLPVSVSFNPPIPSLFCYSTSIRHTHPHKRPSSNHYWICPSGEPIVYWGFRCQWGRKDPADLSVSLTPLSQWVPLPSHSFPCQAGKSKYLSAPTTMASLGEKETLTRAHPRPADKAGVSRGLKMGCGKIKMEPQNIVEKYIP